MIPVLPTMRFPEAGGNLSVLFFARPVQRLSSLQALQWPVTSPGAGVESEAFGDGATAAAKGTALGFGATVSGAQGTALGHGASAGQDNVAIGNGSKAGTGSSAFVMGGFDNSVHNYSNVVTVGLNAAVTGDGGTALGAGATAKDSSVALGSGARTDNVYGVAVGEDAKCQHDDAVSVGRGAHSGTAGDVRLGSSGTDFSDKSLAVVGRVNGTNNSDVFRADATWPDTGGSTYSNQVLFRTNSNGALRTFLRALGASGVNHIYLGVPAGESTAFAKVGGALFDHFADAGNGTTVETDLYSDTVAASVLAANGDKLEAEYGGVFVSSATATRQVKVYFGGTAIFDTGALTLSLSSAWCCYVTIIRVSATVVRYSVSLTTEGAALAAYTAVGELTGLTLSSTNVLKVTGQAAGVGAATNDIVAKLGTVKWMPSSA